MAEVGETGTTHFQGYLELKQAQRLTWLKKALPRAHLEKRKGSRSQAVLYCLKDYQSPPEREAIVIDGVPIGQNPVIYGFDGGADDLIKSLPEKKASVKERLDAIRLLIKEGVPETEIAEKHFDLWCRYSRSFRQYKALIDPPRTEATEVIVIQGPTGTGKSKWALDNFPGAYWKQRSQWWDGYEGQETVILDEFYGWLPFDLLLRLCDRYPLLVESKGGQINMSAKRIVITTNAVPNAWYKNCYFNSFVRRVTTWKVFPIWGEVESYEDYSVAISRFVHNSD